MNHKDLQQLLTEMQNGDKEAFSCIYNELKVPVFTIIYRIVKSKVLAEDVTQDIFIKLYSSAAQLSTNNIRAYIFAMARNAAIDALRKESRNIDDTHYKDNSDTNSIDTKLDIEDAINSLPFTEREILTLHLNVGLKFNEISKIVNLSLPSAYRRYKNAIKTLRAILSGGVL